MDDEKNGRGQPGKGTPSISQAELDALIDNADVGKSSSTPSQTRIVRPVGIKSTSFNSKDFVPGDGADIDQSELDALLSKQNEDEIMTDKQDPGMSQAELDALMGDEGKELFADEPNQPAKAAKSAPAEKVLSQDEIDAMLAALGN